MLQLLGCSKFFLKQRGFFALPIYYKLQHKLKFSIDIPNSLKYSELYECVQWSLANQMWNDTSQWKPNNTIFTEHKQILRGTQLRNDRNYYSFHRRQTIRKIPISNATQNTNIEIAISQQKILKIRNVIMKSYYETLLWNSWNSRTHLEIWTHGSPTKISWLHMCCITYSHRWTKLQFFYKKKDYIWWRVFRSWTNVAKRYVTSMADWMFIWRRPRTSIQERITCYAKEIQALRCECSISSPTTEKKQRYSTCLKVEI